jgi:hypothetical protein
MRHLKAGTILLGSLILAPSAFAQTEVAYANEPRPGYVVFFDKSGGKLSSVADETIRRAASDADRSAGLVRVVGPADYAATVKAELVRGGVPARAIVVVPRTANALPAMSDGISEPASVEIHY